MSEQSGWTQRVEGMMAGTMHEQIRSLVREAQEGLQRFSDAAAEQGSLLADAHQMFVEAQKNLEAGAERTREELVAQLRRGMDETKAQSHELQGEIAGVAASLEAELVDRCSALDGQISGRAAALEARIDTLSEGVDLLWEQSGALEARVSGVETAIAELRAAVEESARATRQSFHALEARMDDTAMMEGRTAKRLVQMLADTFASLKTDAVAEVPSPRLVEVAEPNGWHEPIATAG